MRILFISSYFPDDRHTKNHGVYKRMGMFIDALKKIAEIDMLFFVTPDNYKPDAVKDIEHAFSNHFNTDINLYLCRRSDFKDGTEISKWLSFGAGIFSFYKQKGQLEYSGREQIQAVETCLVRKPSAIFAHRLSAMCPLLLTEKALPPVFFDMDDVEHIVFGRYIKNRKNLQSKLLKLLIPSLVKGEYDAIKLATKTFVCSEIDRSYLSRKFNLPGITVIPNSVAIPELLPLTKEQTLLFLGAYFGPNIEAAEFLVQDIWPKIRDELPEARLIIAGISGDKFNFSEDNIPGLEITGFVEDLDALYKRTRISVVPMLVGGGTRFKIIEAAMYGKPTVSTTLGAEGIDFRHDNIL